MPYQRRTRKEKLVAVLAADMTSATAAAEATGIPRSTLRGWLDDPELADIRRKTREDMAEATQVVAWLAWSALAADIRAGKVDSRDLITAAGVAVDKSQLLAGAATHRVETRDITDVFDDHETRAIVEGAREYLEGTGSGEGAPLAETATVEAPRP